MPSNPWVDKMIAGSPRKGVAAVAIATTYTSGSRPSVTGAQTIANSSTPTVVELLKYCSELQAQIDAANAVLRSYGMIAA